VTVLEQRIAARAATIRLVPLLLTVLAAPIVAVGWLTYRTARSVGVGLRWTAAAFMVGYDAGRSRAG
jgi:hypothetical protein